MSASIAAASANAATSTAQSSKFGGDFNTFLTLLTTQIKNQSPTDPLDTNQMTNQLVQFASVEQQIAMNQNLQRLLALDLHGMIHQRGESGRHGGRAVLDEQVREIVEHRTFFLVGHRGFLLGGVRHFQESLDDPPFQTGGRYGPALVSLRSTRAGPYRSFTEETLHERFRRSAASSSIHLTPSFRADDQVHGRGHAAAGLT